MSISVTVSPSTVGPLVWPSPVLASSPPVSTKLTALVTGDANNGGVTWSIAQGGGAVDAVGNYFPPVDTPRGTGKATVQATSVTDKTKYATATVTF